MKENGIKLILQSKSSPIGSYPGHDTTMTYESPYSDECIENILHGFYSCMIGLTWSPQVILEAMKNFAEDNLPKSNETEED